MRRRCAPVGGNSSWMKHIFLGHTTHNFEFVDELARSANIYKSRQAGTSSNERHIIWEHKHIANKTNIFEDFIRNSSRVAKTTNVKSKEEEEKLELQPSSLSTQQFLFIALAGNTPTTRMNSRRRETEWRIHGCVDHVGTLMPATRSHFCGARCMPKML